MPEAPLPAAPVADAVAEPVDVRDADPDEAAFELVAAADDPEAAVFDALAAVEPAAAEDAPSICA